MLPDRTDQVKAGVSDSSEGRTPRLRTITCLVVLAATVLVLVRNELAVADLGHGDSASVGPISMRVTSTWVDEEEPAESSTSLFTEFGPTPFVAGWGAGLACIAGGGVMALVGLWRGRRRRVLWPWLLSWSMLAVGAIVVYAMVVLNARANSTPITIDGVSAAAIGATLMFGIISAIPWQHSSLLQRLLPGGVVGRTVAPAAPPLVTPGAGPGAEPAARRWSPRRRWYVVAGVIAVAGLVAVLVGGHGGPRYDTYEDFLERGRKAADDLGGERVTRSSLIAVFGEPVLTRGDGTNWSDARGELWYYELKAGGAASLQVLFPREGDGDQARLRRTEYVDPGAFARIRSKR